MKTFLDHLNEEINIGALSSGGIDIERDAIRDEINGILAGIAARPCVTPYSSLNKVRKALAYFHIHLPKRVYLEGRHGVEVWEVNQFGDKMGVTDQGEWIHHVPAKYFLFFHYHMVGSMYFLQAKIVDDKELEKRISDAEAMIAEETDAACRQDVAKHSAPKEPMHDVTSDEKKKGNKEAVADSEKKSLDEAKRRYVRPAFRGPNTPPAENPNPQKVSPAMQKAFDRIDAAFKPGSIKVGGQKKVDEEKGPCWKGYEMVGMKNKKGRKVPNCVPTNEEQIDELYGKGKLKGITKHHKRESEKAANMAARQKYAKDHDRYLDKSDDHWNQAVRGMDLQKKQEKRENPDLKTRLARFKDSKKLNEVSHNLALKAMKGSEKRSEDEYEKDMAYDRLSDHQTHQDRADRLRGHMRRKFGNNKPGRGENTGGDMDDRRMSDRLKHGKRAGMPSREHITRLKTDIKVRKALGRNKKVNLPEDYQLDEVSKRKAIHAYRERESQHRGEYNQGWGSEGQNPNDDYGERSGEKAKKTLARIGKMFGSKTAAQAKRGADIDSSGRGHKGGTDYLDAKQSVYSKFSRPNSKKGTEQRKRYMSMNKGRFAKEETLNELKPATIARYKKEAESDKRSAEISADVSRAGRKNRANPLKSRIEHGKEEKWLRGIAKKRERGIAMADKRLEEKLTKGMSAGDVIHDFVHSDDPKFKGKSKKERQKMALGAYYGMHPEKSRKE